ncbi:unnamed protein product [Peronospora effusa]|uniref:Uncharacterized protein n=1 Tax=Peronospora effusa TaxID=542832 RepID=A0A3M6V8K9_9STRA|nr:hypothetical protein DD238_008534 [Peronospora effusa]RMX63419.1 hypothetical protein DD238_007430 [Peronospora effusa]RMX63424.1 hypothetical protein DD238_007428 [Peronospora effusa]RQM18789.1 hypothetical protein DD237_007900 [Peronospora effusa]RQM18792.1 hypothetical protein DD237_007899 [Peronospora effusa]
MSFLYFCIHFSRKSKPGARRARITNTKYRSASFRADNDTQHLKLQQPERWQEYLGLSNEVKKGFFENAQPIKHTLHSHFGSQQVPRQHTINALIVDQIIGEVLWDPDEVEGESHTKIM